MWIITNCGTFLKRQEYQTTLPASWETCMQVFLQLLEPVMEQWTGCSKRSTSRLYIVTLLIYLTYMQSISCEMLGWMRHKLESRLPGEIPITSDMQMTATLWQKQRGTEEPLDESERGEWKGWLKTQRSKTKIMASGPITSWQIDGQIVETVSDYFLGLQNHCRWWL